MAETIDCQLAGRTRMNTLEVGGSGCSISSFDDRFKVSSKHSL